MSVENTLTFTNYGSEDEKPGNIKTRVTVSPGMVLFVIASAEHKYTIEAIDLWHVNVMLTDGSNLELFINLTDLTTLERAIGMWFSPN